MRLLGITLRVVEVAGAVLQMATGAGNAGAADNIPAAANLMVMQSRLIAAINATNDTTIATPAAEQMRNVLPGVMEGWLMNYANYPMTLGNGRSVQDPAQKAIANAIDREPSSGFRNESTTAYYFVGRFCVGCIIDMDRLFRIVDAAFLSLNTVSSNNNQFYFWVVAFNCK
jgi:hypothetical protein